MNNHHKSILLKFFYLLNNKPGLDVVEIGKQLTKDGADSLFTAGFWIWDIEKNIEYYSPKFFAALGFFDQELPYIPETWQKLIEPDCLILAKKNFKKCLETGGEHPYDQIVYYNRKDKKKIRLNCSGSLIKRDGKAQALIGTHIVL